MNNHNVGVHYDALLDLVDIDSIPEDEADRGCYATIKPVFKPAGIRHEILKRREKDYTFPHNFRVFVGTWNVNGQTASEGLGPWLNVDDIKADIYAIGFQELDLSKEAFLFNDSAREEEWNKAIEKALQRVGAYFKVLMCSLSFTFLTIHREVCKGSLYLVLQGMIQGTLNGRLHNMFCI